ncbi:TIGR00725 family protein [archaeon]|nr:TIGR00725 family protein [archaeon]
MANQIAVIGAGTASGETRRLAEDLGREIAAKGAILICGGLGGVMEAAARGAKEGGGTTVGILPGNDKSGANDYIDIKIVTAMSHARNAIIAHTADALIAVGGQYGTLCEIALGLKLKKRVIVLVGAKNPFTDVKGIKLAKTPKEAVEMALGA